MDLIDLGTLDARWLGWRLQSHQLRSPHGDRLNPERLIGIMLREALHQRYHVAKLKRERAEQSARVIWIPRRELHTDVA